MNRRAWAVAILTVLSHAATAQTYPQRAVRIVVPVAAGGATDLLTRALGQRLAAIWGQPVITDNRPGGGSNLGFEVAATAPADGYTLLMAQPAFATNVSLYKKLAYDPLRDFAPIILTATGPNVLVIHPRVPARTLKEFIALAKAKPHQLNYASSGNGTSGHLAGEMVKAVAGIDMVHVPYKGASASITDLIGGQVDMAIVSLSSVASQITAHRLLGLAISGKRRSPLMPDIPTFTEAGLKGVELDGWYGVLAPAATPRDIITRVHDDISRVLAQPEFVRTLNAASLEPADPNTPEEFTAFLRAEIARWAQVVKLSGATVY